MHSFGILADPGGDEPPQRRVREDAIGGLVVFCVSAALSTGVAFALTMVANLLG